MTSQSQEHDMTRITRRIRLGLVGVLGAMAIACASNPPPADAVYVERQPPRERVEVVGVAPGPGYAWVRGFWRWGGAEYAWVPGRWTAPQRGFHRWEPGQWRHGRRGWFWAEGRWR
jgi:hypothetical protein